jgi:preprotein translocase subunit SecE
MAPSFVELNRSPSGKSPTSSDYSATVEPSATKGAAMNKIVQFFKDSYAELRKVVWPSREDVVASTKVVIVSTVVMALVLGLLDFLLVAGIDFIFR